MYVYSSYIFTVLNCLFNIYSYSTFVYVQYILTFLIFNPTGGTSLGVIANVLHTNASVYLQYALTPLIQRQVGFLLTFPMLLVLSSMYSWEVLINFSRDNKR